ncbi:MAG TPA: hypothetical protein ENF75_01020 [Acidilobales archaeon]|nr:MAG: hypothetical protein DRO18_08210 [Thermoprotei archaeon]HDD25656.1 hypothetical protein [Acidilobales archaeon]
MRIAILNITKLKDSLTVSLAIYDEEGKKVFEANEVNVKSIEIKGLVRLTHTFMPNMVSLSAELSEGKYFREEIDGKVRLILR